MSIKIAYLILCHKDPEFVQRTCNKLTEGTSNHVFIHVDKKSPLEPFSSCLSNTERIHLLETRFPVHWGGYEAIPATIALFKAACESQKFDRYVLLQGTDYPIRSNSEIENYFSAHPETEFIRAVSESQSLNNSDRSKYVLRHCMGTTSLWGRAVNYLSYYIEKCWPGRLPRPSITIDGVKCEIYRGWAQIALTDHAVRFILDFHESHPKFNAFFRHVFAPDESYFHTILYNSPFAAKTPDGKALPENQRSISALLNLTYFEYPDLIRVFTKKEEFQLLHDSGYLYFRKATSQSKELLDYIDEMHRSQR